MASDTRHADHLITGKAGEDHAAEYLRAKGYAFLARNWRPQGRAARYELDLVCRHGETVVFVEVKTRTGQAGACGACTDKKASLVNFTRQKQRALVQAAHRYLSENGLWRSPCRFDLVCITFFSGATPCVEHYPHVIELTLSLDSSHTAWQPW